MADLTGHDQRDGVGRRRLVYWYRAGPAPGLERPPRRRTPPTWAACDVLYRGLIV